MTRKESLKIASSRQKVTVPYPTMPINEFFASNVFNKQKMREYLPEEIFNSLINSIEKGEAIDYSIAQHVAAGMKNWALSKNATHYTHWFQPLTGSTAEKHDSFFHLSPDGQALETFSGSSLVQQEPDASSFPSGGIRNTFEARGYTAWDTSSPAFIYESPAGNTLCIPTIFISYTGESLDYKSPLLKSLIAVEKAAVDVCNYFDKSITKVYPTLGIEQEYFLVDDAIFNARPDLMMCGRSVYGSSPARGQQLDDHYFGSIPERVQAYMIDFEQESHKLGIPLKTRHNEVAPGQFECAPLFEEMNLAVDHNLLLMDVMERVSKRHKFRVLFHEKPFSGINGSGKHNNWSLSTNTGKNLLSPGKTPKNNLMFLTFFVNVIKAYHNHADLMRATIASAGNDYRLGANEAPPAIMSAFIGKQLSEVLDAIEHSKVDVAEGKEINLSKIGIPKIPEILLDNTDRNRTSPFAFTGNKFEFRAVGSSANPAAPMATLNAAVAEQLIAFKAEMDERMGNGESRDVAVLSILARYISESKNIIFEGNGYGDEWVELAKQRGLNNIKNTPDALDGMVTEKALKLFETTKIYTERELHARHEIQLEIFTKKIQIESRLMEDLALNQIVPTVLNYQNLLVKTVNGQKEIGISKAVLQPQIALIEKIANHLSDVLTNVDAMVNARKKANLIDDVKEKAVAYSSDVKGNYFDKIRLHVDKLELIVDDKLWPLAKYRELMFIK